MQKRQRSILLSLVIAISLATGPLFGFAQPSDVCDSMQGSVEMHAMVHAGHDLQHAEHTAHLTVPAPEHGSMQADCCDGDCQCNASLSSSTVMMVGESFDLSLDPDNTAIIHTPAYAVQAPRCSYKPPIFA